MSEARNEHGKKEAAKSKRTERWFKTSSKNVRAFYYWGKIVGVNPLSLSERNQLRYSYTSLLYACFLGIIYCYIFYHALMERLKMLLPGETPIGIIVDFLAINSQFLENLSTWLVFATRQNRIKIIVKSFQRVERSSKKLGIPDNCDKLFKEFGANVILHNVAYVASIVLSCVMWRNFEEFNFLVWIVFDIHSIVSFNAVIVFVWCLILVRRKFHRLNETVQFLMQNETGKAANVEEGSSGFIRQSSFDKDPLLDRVNTVSQLHRDLREIICHIEEFFSALLLFTVSSSFVNLAVNIYNLYRYTKGHPMNIMTLAYLIGVSHWILYPAAILVVISNVCGSTSDEANNTGRMLHKMLNTRTRISDFRIVDRFNWLSLVLLQNRASMSVFGLFKLDHYLFYSTVATSMSYVAIMLQLYD